MSISSLTWINLIKWSYAYLCDSNPLPDFYILKIRAWLCEFIAEGIISLAFLIKKLLAFTMIWEITLEWFRSILEWFHMIPEWNEFIPK